MRVNLPVSTQEYAFPKGQTLVSTTDLKGRILYCNPMFIEVSGYEKEELLGQPHNIVRHPDMPEEAYRDMWHTISNGTPWSAPVKNRRKDGTFYWVMANVTPLMQGDQPTGYMSVRTEATREQIQAAEQLYKQMQAEKQAGQLVHSLRVGVLVKNNLWGRLSGVLHLGAMGKMMACTLVLVVASWCAALAGGHTLTLWDRAPHGWACCCWHWAWRCTCTRPRWRRSRRCCAGPTAWRRAASRKRFRRHAATR